MHLFTILAFYLVLNLSGSDETDECSLSFTVNRNVAKLGLHRDLVYSVEVITNGLWDKCILCIEECIPKGLYINKNQIEDLQRFGKLYAILNGTDDVESPENEALPQTILAYTNMTQSHNMLRSEMEIPFHIRYHMTQEGGGYRNATIAPPNIYINCNVSPTTCETNDTVQFACDPSNTELCLFQKVSYQINAENITIDVPVGDSNHYDLVQVLTFFVTTIGTLYIFGIVMLNKPRSF